MQQQDAGDDEMNDNDAYFSTTQLITTQDNVAYGQIERDYILLSDQCDEREIIKAKKTMAR